MQKRRILLSFAAIALFITALTPVLSYGIPAPSGVTALTSAFENAEPVTLSSSTLESPVQALFRMRYTAELSGTTEIGFATSVCEACVMASTDQGLSLVESREACKRACDLNDSSL